MEILATRESVRRFVQAARAADDRLGFVPTMGYLHDGHLSLVDLALQQADVAVMSIFVNPTQFGPNEDLAAYPRDLDRDFALAEAAGVGAVFTPTREMMYPKGFQTYVSLESLPDRLCGRSRPVHFQGVATVVTKLFHLVCPDVAVFGEKDFQQLAVIRRMVADLDMDIRIVGGPTVREADGLAMSSRNAYLSSAERSEAVVLSQALAEAQQCVASGERRSDAVVQAVRERFAGASLVQEEYIAVCDPDRLDAVASIDGPARLLIAAMVGKTRLIDNGPLMPTHLPAAG